MVDAAEARFDYLSPGDAAALPGPVKGTPKTRKVDPQKEYVSGGNAYNGFIAAYFRSLPHYIDDLSRDFGDDIYERMLLDPQINSCLHVFIRAILADGVNLRPAVEDKGDPDFELASEINDFCERCLANLPRSIDEWLAEMLRALAVGNKVSEKIFTEGTGPDADKLVIGRLKVKPRRATAFVVDAYYNVIGLLGIRPDQPSLVLAAGIVDTPAKIENLLPRDKFAVLTWGQTNEDPRGSSLLRPVYTPWSMKMQAWGQYLKYLAQCAQPSLLGFTAEDATHQPPQDVLGNVVPASDASPDLTPEQVMLNALIAFQGGTAAVFPYGSDVKWIMPPGAGQQFTSCIAMCDQQIAKGILGQTLATEQSQFGTRAQAQVHQDTFGRNVLQGKRLAAHMVRKDLLYALTLYNYGRDAADRLTPVVTLNSVEAQDFTGVAASIAALTSSGYLDPSQYPGLDEKYGLPPRDPDGLLPDDNADVSGEGGPTDAGGEGDEDQGDVAGFADPEGVGVTGYARRGESADFDGQAIFCGGPGSGVPGPCPGPNSRKLAQEAGRHRGRAVQAERRAAALKDQRDRASNREENLLNKVGRSEAKLNRLKANLAQARNDHAANPTAETKAALDKAQADHDAHADRHADLKDAYKSAVDRTDQLHDAHTQALADAQAFHAKADAAEKLMGGAVKQDLADKAAKDKEAADKANQALAGRIPTTPSTGGNAFTNDTPVRGGMGRGGGGYGGTGRQSSGSGGGHSGGGGAGSGGGGGGHSGGGGAGSGGGGGKGGGGSPQGGKPAKPKKKPKGKEGRDQGGLTTTQRLISGAAARTPMRRGRFVRFSVDDGHWVTLDFGSPDRSRHPAGTADGGRFAPADGGVPDLHKELAKRADKKASSVLKKAVSVATPQAVRAKAKEAAGAVVDGLGRRYGPVWGKAILATALAANATPLPGAAPLAFAAMLGAAEVHRAYRRTPAGRPAAALPNDPHALSAEDLKRLGKEFLAEVEKLLGGA